VAVGERALTAKPRGDDVLRRCRIGLSSARFPITIASPPRAWHWPASRPSSPRSERAPAAQWRTTPLFASYFFVRIVDRWRAIERSPGGLSIVKFGPTPARCPDQEIGRLLERADADGIIRLPAHPPGASPPRILAPGVTVTIGDGPWRDLCRPDSARPRACPHQRPRPPNAGPDRRRPGSSVAMKRTCPWPPWRAARWATRRLSADGNFSDISIIALIANMRYMRHTRHTRYLRYFHEA